MIIKLKEDHRKGLNEYLFREPDINMFIIGDVENLGFYSDIQDLWGDFNEDGNYKAVLLRYKVCFIVYATEKYDIEGFVKIINSFEVSEISGKHEIIEEIKGYLNTCKEKRRLFCKLSKESFNVGSVQDYHHHVERSNADDVEGMMNLREKITEFSETTREGMLSLAVSNHGRTVVIKEQNKVISMASTDAETEISAMVVNVCTDPELRGKGLASTCVGKLCEEVLKEGKTLYLCYDNPKAGSIYRRLGFKDVGKWTTIFIFQS